MNATKYAVFAVLGTVLTVGDPSLGAYAGEQAAHGPLVLAAAQQVHKG